MSKTFSKISTTTWNKLNKLSKKELLKLADLMDIGFFEKDKDEIDFLLSTKPEPKIIKALKALKV